MCAKLQLVVTKVHSRGRAASAGFGRKSGGCNPKFGEQVAIGPHRLAQASSANEGYRHAEGSRGRRAHETAAASSPSTETSARLPGSGERRASGGVLVDPGGPSLPTYTGSRDGVADAHVQDRGRSVELGVGPGGGGGGGARGPRRRAGPG